MEDNEMLNLFNGEGENPPPIKRVNSKNANKYVQALTASTPSSEGYTSPDYATNLEKGLKIGSENPFDVSQKEEADAQSFGKQLSMTTGNILSNVVTGTIGGVGYLGTLFEESKGDYSNAITDWADRVRNPFGELKRKNNEVTDITDSAFWLNSGQSLVESAIQFGIIAETGGLLAGASASKLGSLLNLGNKATKLIKAGVQGITAMELSYLEGAMSGATVYRDIYKNQYDKLIAKGVDVDRANEIAKKYASEGASTTVKLNTTIGTALNLTGIGSVFNTESNAALQYFTKGAGKRALNEDIKTYTQRLIKDSPEVLESFTKQNYGKLLSEMNQEGIEEVVTQLAENTGRKQGEESKKSSYLGMFQDAFDNLNSVVNDEGVLNYALGAVGGVAQTVLLDNVIPSQKINEYDSNGKLQPLLDNKGEVVTKNGKVQYQQKLVSPRTRDILDNQRYYTQLKDALVSDLSYIEDIQNKIETTTDKTQQEELRRKLYAVNTLDSVFKGVGVNLVESYNKILETNNTDDLSLPYEAKNTELQKQIDEINNSVENVDDLSDEDKAKVEALHKEYVENSKEITKTKGKTQASTLGLSKSKDDNDYKIRATKAINEINQIQHFYDVNKDKYNLPEERNANYAEYITKLQSDVLGRTRIHSDLTNDFLKQKADFQLFSSIEDYSEIEKLLFDGKLASLLEENASLSERIKKGESIEELQDVVDTLNDKVYTAEEAYDKIKEKIERNKQEVDEIEKQIRESQDFKNANESNINKYLESRINKYSDFRFLLDFKKQLDSFERGTSSIKEKIKNVTSNKGRKRFITDTQERIKALKEQLEAEYSVYSYEEARKMNEDEYYYSKVKDIDEFERSKITREIKALEEEVEILEEDFNSKQKVSYFSSFLEYFNFLNNTEYYIRLRKNRIIELTEYLDNLTTIKVKMNESIATATTTSQKDEILKKGKNKVKASVDNSNVEDDESLDDESGKVVEVIDEDIKKENEKKIKKYIDDNFNTMSDFILSQLYSLSDDYNIVDMLNTTIKKYNVTEENRIDLLKNKFIDLFVKLQSLGKASKKELKTLRNELTKLLYVKELEEEYQAQASFIESMNPKRELGDDFEPPSPPDGLFDDIPPNPKDELEDDETLDNESGVVVEVPDFDELANLRREANEAKNKKSDKDKRAEEKRAKELQKSKEATDALNNYIIKIFPNNKATVFEALKSMFDSGVYDFNLIIDIVAKRNNITKPEDIYNLKLAVINLEPYVIGLQELNKKAIADIKKQIKAIKDNNVLEAENSKSKQNTQEETEELPTKLNQISATLNEEAKEREEVIPFTLDMLRLQYGNKSKSDSVNAYNIKEGSKVTIQVDVDGLDKFEFEKLDFPISIILEGKKVGYIPTLGFINKNYIKDGLPLTKLYYPDNFPNNDKIRIEYEDLERQVKKYNIPNVITEKVVNGEKVITVNYYNFNYAKIKNIRNQFVKGDNINTDLVLKSSIKRKSGGRAITQAKATNLTEFFENDINRIRIHNVSSKGLFPAVQNLSRNSFNYKASKVLAVMSYPNAIGERNIYPITVDTLNNNDVKAVTYLFKLFVSANKNNTEALNELVSIYNKLGFDTTGVNPLYVFNDFLSTYYTNISNFSTTTNELDVPILLYYPKNKLGKETNDFVIKVKKKINNKIVEKSYHLSSRNPIQVAEFIENLELFKNKLFTLDSNKLQNLKDKGYYPVFENGKIVPKSMSYATYIQDRIKTRLVFDEDRLDDKKKPIYVQDYVLTLDDDLQSDNNNSVVAEEKQVVISPQNKNKREKIKIAKPEIVIFSLPNNQKKDRIGDINNPIFIQQFINSNIDYKVFIGNFIQASVLNDTFSDNQKLEIYKEALEAKSLTDANKIFHKICK